MIATTADNRCPRCHRVPCQCPKHPRATDRREQGRDTLYLAALRWQMEIDRYTQRRHAQ